MTSTTFDKLTSADVAIPLASATTLGFSALLLNHLHKKRLKTREFRALFQIQGNLVDDGKTKEGLQKQRTTSGRILPVPKSRGQKIAQALKIGKYTAIVSAVILAGYGLYNFFQKK